jgi:aldehyde dehydrogenase (NAD+)
MKRYELYIGGKWIPGMGDPFPASNPYTQQVWAEVSAASAADVDQAVAAARAAYEGTWRRTSGVERARLMTKLADALDDAAERLATLETTDNGKVIRETRGQMGFSARCYRYFAGYADKISGATLPLDNPNMFDFTTREPLGVVGVITAWNSPIGLLTNKLAPALAAGNTVVVKPSEHTSVSTLEFARLVEAVGFPPGVFNVVTGAADIGQALVRHEDVDKISFTGSVGAGRVVARTAGEMIKPVTLELGGKSANIIFADADLDRAVPGAIAGIFAASGQTCIAGSRLLVHEDVHDKVLSAVVSGARAIQLGDPLDPATQMGPVAYRQQLEKITGAIEQATGEGAEVVTGGVGETADLFVPPTVLGGVTNAMSVAQEEIFGPVLSVMTFRSDDEAIAIANDSKYGLAAGIWTDKISRAHSVAKELRCGTVWVNTYRAAAVQAPVGGMKLSGHGRERGWEAIEDYTQIKNTMIDLSADVRDPFTIKS